MSSSKYPIGDEGLSSGKKVALRIGVDGKGEREE